MFLEDFCQNQDNNLKDSSMVCFSLISNKCCMKFRQTSLDVVGGKQLSTKLPAIKIKRNILHR